NSGSVLFGSSSRTTSCSRTDSIAFAFRKMLVSSAGKRVSFLFAKSKIDLIISDSCSVDTSLTFKIIVSLSLFLTVKLKFIVLSPFYYSLGSSTLLNTSLDTQLPKSVLPVHGNVLLNQNSLYSKYHSHLF